MVIVRIIQLQYSYMPEKRGHICYRKDQRGRTSYVENMFSVVFLVSNKALYNTLNISHVYKQRSVCTNTDTETDTHTQTH